ncbi:MAG: hypothetical protein J5825_05255 [Lachnospiraceae bacterium]|nr:hypothetical protein [Lachnospiraceae bacterium]
MKILSAGEPLGTGIEQFLVLNDGAGNIDLRFYLLLIGVYLLVAMPLSYLILAKLKKLKYMKWAVVIIALVFSILIFVEGNKTRFEAPFYYYARVVETAYDEYYEGGAQVREWVFAQFTSPYNGNFEITFKPQYTVVIADNDQSVLQNNLPTVPTEFLLNETPETGQAFAPAPGNGPQYSSEDQADIASIGRMLRPNMIHYLKVEAPNVLTCYGVHPFEKHFLWLSTKPEGYTEEKKSEIEGIRREAQFSVEIKGDKWYVVDTLAGNNSEKYDLGSYSFDELPGLVDGMGYEGYGEPFRQLVSKYAKSHDGDMTVTFCKESSVQFATHENSKYFGYTVLVDWKEKQE